MYLWKNLTYLCRIQKLRLSFKIACPIPWTQLFSHSQMLRTRWSLILALSQVLNVFNITANYLFKKNWTWSFDLVLAGDIAAMWQRDSTNQVWPYVQFAKEDRALQDLIRGLINRQVLSWLLSLFLFYSSLVTHTLFCFFFFFSLSTQFSLVFLNS